MREDFESYKAELDRVRLTEESKRALAESLRHHKAADRPEIRSRRLTAGAGRIAAVAAVVCLLVTGAVAGVVSSPTLRDLVFGDSAGYEQSSTFIGKSVENHGWTVAITDCVGDNLDLYLGLELTAPEGTVLGEGEYQFGNSPGDIDLTFPDMERGRDTWGIRQIPDDDPTDNKLNFMLHSGTYFPGESYNGQRMQLKIYDLCKAWYDVERQERIEDPVCNGAWDFGEITVDLPHSTIHLEPNVPVTTLDVEATITEVMVSPISVLVRIEGDALKGHHEWVPKNAPDGYYGCIDYQEIILYSEDGSTVPAEYTRAGTGCWGGEADSDEEGMLLLQRIYAPHTNEIPCKLVDVDSLTAISICGVMIPLK